MKLAMWVYIFCLICQQDVVIDSGMARSKSSKNAATTLDTVVVGGVELDKKERAKRIRSFARRCELGKRRSNYSWSSAKEDTRRKYPHPGRPPAFESIDDLYEGLLAYFEQCDERIQQVIVKSRTEGATLIDVPDPAPKDVEHLCLFLGISRQTWYNYNQPDHPFYAVCQWFDMVSAASWYEQAENPKRARVAMFVLQAKHGHVIRKDITSDGKQIGGSLGALLEEIDGSGFTISKGGEG